MKTFCAFILAALVVAVTSYYQDDATEVFKCPICVGLGKKAERKCDNEAVYRACHAEDAVCVSTKNGELVMRECQSKKYYNDYIVPKCDGIENCEHAMCEESDCTAYLSKDKKETYTTPLECPVCIGMGENAESDCDESTKSFMCNDKIAACITVKDSGLFWRDCLNYNYYRSAIKPFCDRKEGCETSFCREQGCAAPLSTDEGDEVEGTGLSINGVKIPTGIANKKKLSKPLFKDFA